MVIPLCWHGSAAWGQDDVASLQRQYSQAVVQWQSYAATQPQGRVPHPASDFLPRFRQFAEQHAGKPEALPALMWILGNAPNAFGDPNQPRMWMHWAIDQMAANHSKDPSIDNVLPQVRSTVYQVGTKPLTDFYNKVAAEHPNRSTKATALLSEAGMLLSNPASSVAEKKQGMDLLRQVATDYKDLPLAEEAANALFDLEHLQIGSKAPEIEGEDENGKKIRLSQFKGQVVVLDFWGFW